MTSEQQTAIAAVDINLQMAIDTLSQTSMAPVDGINSVREHLVKAQHLLDGVVFQEGTPSAKKSVVDRMIRDIAIRDAASPKMLPPS